MRPSIGSVKSTPKETRTFPLQCEGFRASITVRRMGTIEFVRAEDETADAVRKYVTGSGPARKDGTVDRTSDDYVAPVRLLHNGEEVVLSARSCRAITYVTLAQVGDSEADLYPFEELARMCVNDDLALQITDVFFWVFGQDIKTPGQEGDQDVPLSASSAEPPPT